MGGEGAISGMIISLKNNLNLRHKKADSHKHVSEKSKTGLPLTFKNQMSKRDMESFKTQLQIKKRKSTILAYILISIAIILSVLIFYYLIY